MKSTIDDTKQLFELIEQDVIQAWLFGTVAQKFGDAMLSNKLPFDSWLYKTVFVANLREMLMALARLTDNDKGTASIPIFLNHAEQNPQNFQAVISQASDRQLTEEDFRKKVTELKKEFAQLQQQSTKVKTYRDQILAHTDRRGGDGTLSMGFGEDLLQEMKPYLDELHSLTNNISALLHDSQLLMLNAETNIEKDFAQLLEDREPRNQVVQAARMRLLERSSS